MPPLCCIGDFNAIPTLSDKFGGSQKLNTNNKAFRDLLSQTNLIDLGFKGPAYTWSSNLNTSKPIHQRLDRVIVTTTWSGLYPEAFVNHLPRIFSDHTPIILNTDKKLVHAKNFRVEHWWLHYDSFRKECAELWDRDLNVAWEVKYKKLVRGIKAWRRKITSPKDKLRQIEEKILEVQSLPPPLQNLKEEISLRQEYEEVHAQLLTYWQQRSRVQWATMGDRCSAFFHQAATIRRRRNLITTLLKDDGTWTSNESEVRNLLVTYFKNLYCTARQHSGTVGIPDHIKSQFTKLNVAARTKIGLVPDSEEIRATLWEMGQDRSPGPDGLTVRFLREMWPVLGPDIVNKVRHAFRLGYMPNEWSRVFIVLIPKIDHPQKPTHYRPISVCSVLYRLTMKLVAKRFALHMPSLISTSQTAFLKDRNIHENVILLREVLNCFHSENCPSSAFALKLDLFKAFDTVQWNFIKEILLAINTPPNITNLIYSAMSTSKFSVKLNGVAEGGFFTASRGLKQGCPMSPYLFILATEVLSKLFNEAVQSSQIHGFKVKPNADPITHALYADDLVIFGITQQQEVRTMRGILDTFTSMSGLRENPEKSVIWFSKRATSRDKRGVLSIFPVEYAPRTTTYLGCPISKAGYYTRDFINLKEQILNKLAGWKLHTLSFAGRTELIRSVLQSMPMHVMATQLLPKKVLNDLSSIFKKFLWGKIGHNRYLALVGWEKICTTFQQGGLNIRNLHTLNISWVMKTLYNFLAGNKTTWAKVCGAKYCEGKGFWEGNYQRGNSDLWKAFHKIKHCIKADLLWIIGSGSKIPTIGQPWYPNWEIDIQRAPQATDLSVRDLFDFQLNQWRIQNLTQIFHPNSVHQIQSLKPTPTQDLTVPDRLVWKPSKNGLFSLKLAYQFLANQS
ncbi:hypothetical protein LUZ63_002786 [Rhynchospora breviuscula]|uniref:Reverse transcriptase domain-containing protein n=1 Tax=Rhynchospora breviuscula TaxID=2022672 RepID=A0A9Q0CZD7_9POAL|nr:hypothetical protein LUZ63_002786 [Rhynchospora breviuscula]